MTERFKKAYDTLTRAYFEGTLAKGTCIACACGNIIYAAINDPVTKEDLDNEIARWNDPTGSFMSATKSIPAGPLWAQKRYPEGSAYYPNKGAADLVNEAGYTTAEFAMIETAFERNTEHSYTSYPWLDDQVILEDQYKGLCAVVDVLLKLDGEDSQGEELKKEFRKHPKLVVA